MKIGAVEPHRAARQHGALRVLLRTAGARVDGLPFVHGAYDSVFIKDNALLVDEQGHRRALLAQPCYAQRGIEQRARHRALAEHGFSVDGAGKASFEGGDVVVLAGGRGAILGTGFRSRSNAAVEIERFLGAPVQVVELRDPHLYHLDTACFALRDGTVAFCPEAFTKASVRWFDQNIPPDRLLRVSVSDARGFALNLIEVGRHLILGGASAALEAELRRRGWVVHVPDLHQFRFAGGSAACLVSRVHELRRSVEGKALSAA